MPKRKVQPEDVEYVRKNCLTKSDEQMAIDLNRDTRTIAGIRKKLGIVKGVGGRISQVVRQDKNNQAFVQASQALTEQQRKEFFKTQLANSLSYSTLKEQFTKTEIDFYLEEWGSLCVQFEDIVATEKRQIDEYIKARIMGDRILRYIKLANDEIEIVASEVDQYRKSHDMQNDEEAQERDVQLTMLAQRLSSVVDGMTKNYKDNVTLRNNLLEQLNARRKDRVEQIKKGGTTFHGIIESLRDRKVKESQGRHMELVRIAKEKKKAEWQKPIKYPDGSTDCVLMDDGSELPKKDIVLLSNGSRMVDRYNEDQGKRVLLVENDIYRVQFFQSKFKNHNIDYASSYDKAVEFLNNNQYDLVCLDYDIGMDKKGSEVASYIVENNLCKDSDILVHSMNKDGAEKIDQILSGKRTVETVPFKKIEENKNA